MKLNRLFDFLERAYQRADVRAVFGEPQTIGDRTIIPVARVGYALGLGFGQGERPTEAEVDAETGGAGAGGGGGGMATPVAVLEVTEDDIKVVPIVDSTKLGLVGILVVAWNIFWITRTIRILRERKA